MGSPAKSVVPIKGLSGLKEALAEAGGKFNPDRTVLPVPDRSFGGTMGHTIDKSVPDWTIIPGVQAPEDAPNILVVLIDDAGFGNPDTFGGPIRTPNLTRVKEMGITYDRFHVTAVCYQHVLPCSQDAISIGLDLDLIGISWSISWLFYFKTEKCRPFPRILQENGYVTGGFGKRHLTPDNVQGAAGPFDHWPLSWGFDHYWGF